jgi:hypothetical protein
MFKLILLWCASYNQGLLLSNIPFSLSIFPVTLGRISLEFEPHPAVQAPITIHWRRDQGDPTDFNIHKFRHNGGGLSSPNRVTVSDSQNEGESVLQFNRDGFVIWLYSKATLITIFLPGNFTWLCKLL